MTHWPRWRMRHRGVVSIPTKDSMTRPLFRTYRVSYFIEFPFLPSSLYIIKQWFIGPFPNHFARSHAVKFYWMRRRKMISKWASAGAARSLTSTVPSRRSQTSEVRGQKSFLPISYCNRWCVEGADYRTIKCQTVSRYIHSLDDIINIDRARSWILSELCYWI